MLWGWVGLVWCGVVWFGLIWLSLVWFGLVLNLFFISCQIRRKLLGLFTTKENILFIRGSYRVNIYFHQTGSKQYSTLYRVHSTCSGDLWNNYALGSSSPRLRSHPHIAVKCRGSNCTYILDYFVQKGFYCVHLTNLLPGFLIF